MQHARWREVASTEADLRRRAKQILLAHDRYLAGARVEGVRQLVLDSWRRSLGAGVDPEKTAPALLDSAQLTQRRAEHPLSEAMPLIRHLLLDSVVDSGMLLALTDADGRLLWVDGHPGMRTRAEQMLFVPGADWSESAVGTNAPGTALALDGPVQIFAAEHLSRTVTPWSCSAAPIHDPDTGAVLGVLDLTGGDDIAGPQSLSLVRVTVAAIETQLRLDRMQRTAARSSRVPRADPRPGDRLEVLGAHQAVLRTFEAGAEHLRRLSPRHSELLLLLVDSGDGMSAAELGVALSERDLPAVTVRAEMSRLRTVLGPLRLSSRPYRLREPIATDLEDVRTAMRAGDYRGAVSCYRGPVLPFSESPGIRELREDLHCGLRAGLLRSENPEALLSFAESPHGRDDLAVWRAAQRCLPLGSPKRAHVSEHLRRLLDRSA